MQLCRRYISYKEKGNVLKFVRQTLLGVGIVALGTIALSPSWGSFFLGLSAMAASLALLALEQV